VNHTRQVNIGAKYIKLIAAYFCSLACALAGPALAAQFGLDVRTSNSTCVAFPRPNTNASVNFVQPYPQLSIPDMVALAMPPGDSSHWYYTTLHGLIGRFENRPDVSSSQVLLDLTSRVQVPDNGGLLQLIFHPNFPTDRRIFVNYNRWGTSSLTWDTVTGPRYMRPEDNQAVKDVELVFIEPANTEKGYAASQYVKVDGKLVILPPAPGQKLKLRTA